MARRSVNPFGGDSGSSSTTNRNYDPAALAEESGVSTAPSEPFNFQSLIDILNAPSYYTERFLTGGSKYDERLDELGLKNTKGQLDLNDVLSTSARMVADPLNFIAPLKVAKLAAKVPGVAKAASTTAKTAGKIPGAKVAKEGLENMFVAGAKTKRVSPELYEELRSLKTATTAKQAQAARDVGRTFADVPKEIRDDVGRLVERQAAGEALTPDELAAVEKAKNFISTRITEPERAAGLLPNELAAYFPRKADREAVEGLMKFGNGAGLPQTLGGAEKARKYATQAAGEEAGVVYKNALEALAIRASKSEAARANKAFMARVIAGDVKDIDGNALFKPMTKNDQLLDGHVTVRIDKNGMRVGDRFLGFYPTKSQNGKDIIGVASKAANFQVPAEAAEAISKYYNTFTNDESTKAFLKVYDGLLNTWKGTVTSIFPAFHIRNAMGNLANMWLGGFIDKNPASIVKAGKFFNDARKIQTGGSVNINGTAITGDLLEQLGVAGRGQYGADIPQMIKEGIDYRKPFAERSGLEKLGTVATLDAKKVFSGIGDKNIAGKVGTVLGSPMEIGRNAGATLEDNARIAFFLQQLDKSGDVKTAVAQTRKYLFDYTELTEFEKQGMKRVMPFYTWARNNIPLQVEGLMKSPGIAAAQFKLFQNVFPLEDEDREVLPEYLGERMTGALPDSNPDDELINVFTNLGLPVEDLGRFTRGDRTVEKEILSQTGPLGNFLGIASNRDYFRGEQLDKLGYAYGRDAAGLPQFVKDYLEFREETAKDGSPYYYVNPYKYAALQAIIGRVMRTTDDPAAAIRIGTVSEKDLSEEELRRKDEFEKQIEQELIKKGVLKQFQTNYVPDNSDDTTPGRDRKRSTVNPF